VARPKRDNTSVEPEMKRLAVEFSQFRQDNNLSQKLLAEVIGISRRTIQSVEAGRILPHKQTLDAFEKLKLKYASEGKSKHKKSQAA